MADLVKGVSRRVIVVRSPDPRFFEQAIFLMKEEPIRSGDVSAEQVVAEARRVAAGYLRRNASGRRPWRRHPGAAWFLLGSALIGLLWGLTALML